MGSYRLQFNIVSQIHIPFDRHASGGSEEYHIELARRLAARGHAVVSYAPLPQAASRGTWDAVEWRDITELDATAPGFWLIQRDPSIGNKFVDQRARVKRTQYLAFGAHDVDYPSVNGKSWTAPYAAVLADSNFHADMLRGAHPHANVLATGVGPMLDRVGQMKPLTRDPKRLIWASSYVRGLNALLDVYERALEWVPDLKLDICYGWESIDAVIPQNPQLARFKEQLSHRMTCYPGVTHLGRLGSDITVWERYTYAGLWVYPTEWPETACQAAMLAQCFGAVPICSRVWALNENDTVKHGVLISGAPYGDRLTRARFTQELVRLASSPDLQETIRKPMIPDARGRFGFDAVVDRVEHFALTHDPARRVVSITEGARHAR